MSEISAIKRIGQLWKLYLTYWCSRMGVLMMSIGAFILFIPPLSIFGGAFILVGSHLLLGSIMLALFAIRCPVCRASALLSWEALTGWRAVFRLIRPTKLSKSVLSREIVSSCGAMPQPDGCSCPTHERDLNCEFHDQCQDCGALLVDRRGLVLGSLMAESGVPYSWVQNLSGTWRTRTESEEGGNAVVELSMTGRLDETLGWPYQSIATTTQAATP